MRGIRRSILAGAVALGALIGPALVPTAAQAAVTLYPAAPTEAFGGTGSGEGQFEGPGGIAVNEATGDVYVMDVGTEPRLATPKVEKFDAEGKFISQFDIPPISGSPFYLRGAIAVDNAGDAAKGDVYVGTEGALEVYGPEGEHLFQLAIPGGGEVSAVTVDPSGNVWTLSGEAIVHEFSDTGTLLDEFNPGLYEPEPGLAVDSSNNVYVGYFREAFKFSAAGNLAGQFLLNERAAGPASGIAINSFITKGDVLVARWARLEEYGPGAEPFTQPVRRFGNSLAEVRGMAVNSTTGAIYVSEVPKNMIDVFRPLIVDQPLVNDRTVAAPRVTRTTAQLFGVINSENNPTSYHFEYVPASEYEAGASDPFINSANAVAGTLPASMLDQEVTPAGITGLLAGTTYYYRLAATNEGGTGYGPTQTFTTSPATPPSVTTGPAREVTQTTATLTGVVVPETLQTSYEFEVGTDTTYGGARLYGNAGRSGGSESVSTILQYLVPGLTYHYRLVATNEDGTTYGQDVTFTTPGVSAPIAQPQTALLIASEAVQFPLISGASTQSSGRHARKKAKVRKKAHRKGRRRKSSEGRAGSGKRSARQGGGKAR